MADRSGESGPVTGAGASSHSVAHLQLLLPALAGPGDDTAEIVLTQVKIYGGSMSLGQRLAAFRALLGL